MSSDRLKKQIDFLIEIDKIKNIFRQTDLMDGSRRENDAEHSWHLAMMTILLSEYANEKIDVLKTIKMVLIHDLVEIDAGDTFCYDEKGYEDKEEREKRAADRIFNILEEDQAKELRRLWDEFEAMDTPEAKFANAVDRMQPMIHNYVNKGGSWIRHDVEKEQIVERARPIEEGAEELGKYIDKLIENSLKKGYIAQEKHSEDYKAYVDGSYLNGNVGYGAVILNDSDVVEEIYGRVTRPDYINSRQVGGEIMAVINTLKWCGKKGLDKISIYYDFENLEKWATGRYKTNNKMTKSYKSYIDNCNIDIKWYKVDSHTGVKWNDRADELAKKGANIKDIEDVSKDPFIEELENAVDLLIDKLVDWGYEVNYKGIYNGNCAKLQVLKDIEKIGHINIYNTKNKHLKPYYGEIKDEDEKNKLSEIIDRELEELK
ncbi:HD domain-containing protein [Clostridiisalibacter paucivorans]|uniref:HD domain-containing protein n=1 Tax=Clostridiisalibacter paucivorans TaxID=408753 RepID=UPI0009FFADC3|nr:HD domain-containing protein [Clostridiisalibacter paucivorans]